VEKTDFSAKNFLQVNNKLSVKEKQQDGRVSPGGFVSLQVL
jgi:hypothetical protein